MTGDPLPARRWTFPALAASPAAGRAVPDAAAWLAAFADEIGRIAGGAATIEPTAGEGAPLSAAFARADGLAIGFDLPRGLAAAIVGARCGGAFDPEAGDAAAPSLGRVRAELAAAACSAAGIVWPGRGDWAGTALDDPPIRAARVRVRDHDFTLSFAVALPPPPVARADSGATARAIRAALDPVVFELRVVLHDAAIPLARACALRAGDIVPIDTARDVVLRVGDHALARGTVAPDDTGGHRITIAGAAARGIAPRPLEEAR